MVFKLRPRRLYGEQPSPGIFNRPHPPSGPSAWPRFPALLWSVYRCSNTIKPEAWQYWKVKNAAASCSAPSIYEQHNVQHFYIPYCYNTLNVMYCVMEKKYFPGILPKVMVIQGVELKSLEIIASSTAPVATRRSLTPARLVVRVVHRGRGHALWRGDWGCKQIPKRLFLTFCAYPA